MNDGLRAILPPAPWMATFGLVYGVLTRQAGLNLRAFLAPHLRGERGTCKATG